MVRVGSGFSFDASDNVVYERGYTHYIHHVNTDEFNFGELFYAVHRMHLRTPPPTRAWYLIYGQTVPEGLCAIEDDDDLEMMWVNMYGNSRRIAEVYMQDCDFEAGSAPGQFYLLPLGIPRHALAENEMPPIHVQALWEQDERDGEAFVERLQNRCERWYVSAMMYPRGRIGHA